jgi:hypothetical protein
MRPCVIEADFTVAAIAAGAAFFAEMVGAGIFGAADAYSGGLFFANAADKWHDGDH